MSGEAGAMDDEHPPPTQEVIPEDFQSESTEEEDNWSVPEEENDVNWSPARQVWGLRDGATLPNTTLPNESNWELPCEAQESRNWERSRASEGQNWSLPNEANAGGGGGGWSPPNEANTGGGGAGWSPPNEANTGGWGGGWSPPNEANTGGWGGGWSPPNEANTGGWGGGWSPPNEANTGGGGGGGGWSPPNEASTSERGYWSLPNEAGPSDGVNWLLPEGANEKGKSAIPDEASEEPHFLLPNVMVRVGEEGRGAFLGIIREITPDGMYLVAVCDSEDGEHVVLCPSDLKTCLVAPSTMDFVKIVSGKCRHMTGQLVDISPGGEYGVVLLDRTEEMEIVRMGSIGKMAFVTEPVAKERSDENDLPQPQEPQEQKGTEKMAFVTEPVANEPADEKDLPQPQEQKGTETEVLPSTGEKGKTKVEGECSSMNAHHDVDYGLPQTEVPCDGNVVTGTVCGNVTVGPGLGETEDSRPIRRGGTQDESSPVENRGTPKESSRGRVHDYVVSLQNQAQISSTWRALERLRLIDEPEESHPHSSGRPVDENRNRQNDDKDSSLEEAKNLSDVD